MWTGVVCTQVLGLGVSALLKAYETRFALGSEWAHCPIPGDFSPCSCSSGLEAVVMLVLRAPWFLPRSPRPRLSSSKPG